MSTGNARKDSELFLETAHEYGEPLFATAAAHSVYELAMREGLSGLDDASIGTQDGSASVLMAMLNDLHPVATGCAMPYLLAEVQTIDSVSLANVAGGAI